MKIKNNNGQSVLVPKHLEDEVKKHIHEKNHEAINNLVKTFGKKAVRIAQNGTGLSGPVLRSGPNVKNSPTPKNVAVTEAPNPYGANRGFAGFSLADGGRVGYNWQTPMFGWGENGMVTGPYQDGGQAGGGGGGDQIAQAVGQALQQGHKPQEVMQMLVQKGMKPQQAQQVVQQVMQQMQGGDQGGDQGPQMAQTGMGPDLGQTPDGYNWQGNNTQYGDPNQQQFPIINPNPVTIQQPSNQIVQGGPTQQQRPQNNQSFRTGNYYLDRAVYAGNKSVQDAAQGNTTGAVGNGLIAGGSGAEAAFQGVENIAGIIGGLYGNGQARKLEMEQQYYNDRRNRALATPSVGTNSAPAYSQSGGTYPPGKGYKIPYGTLPFAFGGVYQDGGVPTEGTDFKSGDPNVVTEKGETITDPTKGFPGPDGKPTGVVVHDQTGDNHSDASGGNSYNLGPNSTVHSKILGIKVGDFLESLKGHPKEEYIASKILDKYPNQDRQVSYAKLASVFDTKDLAAEVEKIAKKGEDLEKRDMGNENTVIAKKTIDLNKQTLAKQLSMKKQEMAENTEVTGANGPVHQVAESLKMMGAYGGKVQKETMDTANGNPPKAGAGIKMKGKKLLLPKAQTGLTTDDKYYTDPNTNSVDNQAYNQPAQGVPPLTTNQPGNKVVPAQFKVGIPAGPGFGADVLDPATYSPEDTKAVWSKFYTTADKPRLEQLNRGFAPGFNAQPLVDNPREFMRLARTSGFTGDWNSPTFNTDIQQHLLDSTWDSPQGRNALKGVYNRWLETRQGAGDKEISQPFDNLSKDDLTKWFKDDYNGVRTTALLAATQPSAGVAATPTATNQHVDISGIKADGSAYPGNTKRIYQEGLNPWQTVGDMAALFDRRDAAPYIEDQGAKDALGMNTRQQFVNDTAQQNRLFRTYQAATKYNPQNNPSVTAQHAANLWTAQNELASQTSRENADIQKRYEDQNIGLREKAGTNKAKALDELATRTAKVRSAASDRVINALSDIGDKKVRNAGENRASMIYQQMFPNVAYNPWDGLSTNGGGNDLSTLSANSAGAGNKSLADLKKDEIESLIDYHQKRGDQAYASYLKTMRDFKFGLPAGAKPYNPSKQLGGRVQPKMKRKK